MSPAELLAEILAPDSKATRNERDAAAALVRVGPTTGWGYGPEKEQVRNYYLREHLGAMGAHLTARGA